MSFHIEEMVGITTVGDLISALESFPDGLPVQIGDEERLRVLHVKPSQSEQTSRRREFIRIEGDRDAG